MEIVPATKGHIPDIVRLVNSAYRSEGGWTGESHLISGPRTNADDVEELIGKPDGVILSAWKGRELMGCVYLQWEGDQLYLGMLSVWPEKQGQGIGKQLMQAAGDLAKMHRCKTIRITVISLRTELIDWYERHGFRRTGEIEPFHAGDRFGKQKQQLQLAVLEKIVI